MSERKEPALSAFGGIFGGSKQKSHTEILENALGSFNKAQQELTEAYDTIEKQIAQEEREIAEKQQRVQEASESLSKLGRIKDRVREFLS